MDEYIKKNQQMWDHLAPIHRGTSLYKVDDFLEGALTLDPLEIEEVGDVKGKSLLHLQCHFGLDTMSWARLGAEATGVDFSGESIDLAQTLNEQVDDKAKFLESNVYDLPDKLDEQFDIVFTSGGVLCWLPDLKKWANIVASFVKPGGFFYIREFHPVAYIFNDAEDSDNLKVHYPYFHKDEPVEFEQSGTYADPAVRFPIAMKTYEWTHSLSDIINSVIDAGLQVEFFNEFPFTTYQALPFMEEDEENNRWVLPDFAESVPLMFSLKASKPS